MSGGTLLASKGITQAMVSKASGNPGVVCFRNLPFEPSSMQVTAVARYGIAEHNDISVSGSTNASASGCPGLGDSSSAPTAFVTAWNGPGGIDGPAPFADRIDVWFE